MLAAKLNVSVRELARGFSSHAGMTSLRRMAEDPPGSRSLDVLNSNRSVTQIGRTGFADSAHLTRWFSRTFSVAPSTFRQRHLSRPARPGQRAERRHRSDLTDPASSAHAAQGHDLTPTAERASDELSGPAADSVAERSGKWAKAKWSS